MFVVRVLSVITALAFSVLTSATPLIPSAGGHGLSRAATPPHAVFKRHEFVPLVSRDAPSGLAAIMTTIKNNIAPLADQLGLSYPDHVLAVLIINSRFQGLSYRPSRPTRPPKTLLPQPRT